MEEVWEDINLASLQENPGSTITSTTSHPSFPGMILQDFLSKPFGKDQTRRVSSINSSFLEGTSSLGYIELPPTTALSLELVSNPILLSQASGVSSSSGSSMVQNFNNLASSVSSCLLKKRFGRNDDNSADRSHKRMIKNRESAARSRARKQEISSMYTSQLESQIASLKKENAKLTEQHRKLLAAAKQIPDERKLERCATAPF